MNATISNEANISKKNDVSAPKKTEANTPRNPNTPNTPNNPNTPKKTDKNPRKPEVNAAIRRNMDNDHIQLNPGALYFLLEKLRLSLKEAQQILNIGLETMQECLEWTFDCATVRRILTNAEYSPSISDIRRPGDPKCLTSPPTKMVFFSSKSANYLSNCTREERIKAFVNQIHALSLEIAAQARDSQATNALVSKRNLLDGLLKMENFLHNYGRETWIFVTKEYIAIDGWTGEMAEMYFSKQIDYTKHNTTPALLSKTRAHLDMLLNTFDIPNSRYHIICETPDIEEEVRKGFLTPDR